MSCCAALERQGVSLLAAAGRIDPTHTTALRARFVREMNRLFRELMRDIRLSIVDDDGFGLRQGTLLASAGKRAFAFRTDERRISSFMDWLRRREAEGVLSTVTRATGATGWTSTYIDSAYKQGIRNAITQLKRKGKAPQFVIGDPVQAAFLQPIHADRVSALYSRAFEDLKTVIEAANGQARRALADEMSGFLSTAIAEGRSPRTVARKLASQVIKRIDKVGLTRARMIARTEIVRAHHVATISEYERAGIANVNVKAEILTAGFNVCPICVDLAAGGPYSIDRVRGMIPAHPNCRCTTVPVFE